ncbi:TPA: guanitoxin biosynthesis heme-dependent pre-guanitoxin N-hydroxylase GntA, partial [Serratia marcescens]
DAYGFLQQFAGIRETLSKTNATFVLTFSDRDIQSEAEFEDFVWTTLTRLHELDIQAGYEWSKESSADPYSPDFGFSLVGEPFFIVGLHPYSSRISRQAPFPALVFNAHRQFRHLKVDGAFQKMQKEIRRREMKIQGTLNPNLSDFGEQSEARQYAGNATQQVWSCPFSKKINL